MGGGGGGDRGLGELARIGQLSVSRARFAQKSDGPNRSIFKQSNEINRKFRIGCPVRVATEFGKFDSLTFL